MPSDTPEPKYRDERMQAHIDRALKSYQSPQGDQAERYAAITEGTYQLAQKYIDYAPPSAELTLALRDLESARMRVNQAIAVNEPREEPEGHAVRTEPGTSGAQHNIG